MSARLDLTTWKRLRQDDPGSVPSDVVLCSLNQSGEVHKDSYEGTDDRVLTFTISSQVVDREGDTIAVDGWDIDNFIRGGSVLWGHLHTEPAIAKPLHTWVDDGKLKSTAQFTPKDLNPFGYMIYQLAAEGYQRATSVGFRAKKYAENAERGGWYPIDFLEQELTEWSVVNVPANPEALIDARGLGIDLRPMREFAERALDSGAEFDPGTLLSKKELRRLYKVSDDRKSVSVEVSGIELDSDTSKTTDDVTMGDESATDNTPEANHEPTIDELKAAAETARSAEAELVKALRGRVTDAAENLRSAMAEMAEYCDDSEVIETVKSCGIYTGVETDGLVLTRSGLLDLIDAVCSYVETRKG